LQTSGIHVDFSEDFFSDSLQKLGARIALITAEGNEITYEDLVRRAEDIVHGWGHERRLVVIEAANEVEPIAAYVGALRHRHPVIILAPGSDETNRRILDTYQPDIIFKHSPEGWKSFATGNADRPQLHDELAVLLSTSGSTGDPKLVRLSRKNIGTNADAIRQYLALRDDRAITSLPWHYSYGLSVVNSYLASGSTLLLTENSLVDPQFWDFFRAHGGTSLAGVPHAYELLERVGFRRAPPPPSLRYMTVAGGRLDPHLVKEYADWIQANGVAFFVMYGQTEAAPRMAYLPPDLAFEHPGSIGIPIPGGSCRLISEEGKEISEPDVAGELVYRGPNVMMGYASTREDLSRGNELAELRTGDLACRTAQGLYRIVGRASRFSKIFGLRINLADVEQHLAAEGVAARASGNDTLIAVCALGDADTDELEFQLARRFGLNRSAFIVYGAHDYPLLPNGKIDHRSILAQGLRVAVHFEGGSIGINARAVKRRPAYWFQARRRFFPEAPWTSSCGARRRRVHRRFGFMAAAPPFAAEARSRPAVFSSGLYPS
jgi:acyl-CoA synthetase (AMP-forming)/AMP-acid ligase II